MKSCPKIVVSCWLLIVGLLVFASITLVLWVKLALGEFEKWIQPLVWNALFGIINLVKLIPCSTNVFAV